MRRVKLIAMAIPLCAVVAIAGDWTVIHHQNRDYVSFANVAQFYQFHDYTRVNRTVSLRSDRRGIRATAGTSELYVNGVRFFTDFPIVFDNNEDLISIMDVSKMIEPVLRPSRIANAERIETVVLDPGHGGNDQGTMNRWGTEKGFALDVAMSARDELLRAGIKVELTRSDDTYVALEDRVQFANRFPHAVFISIHFNSGGGAGVESYTLAPAGVPSNASNESHVAPNEVQACEGNLHDPHNIALSAAVHATVLARTGAFDRGVRHARFHVLRNIKIPAVLVEGGFVSDPAEGQRIATAQYRQRLGQAIAQGVQNYNNAVNYRGGGGTLASARMNLPPHEHSITEPLQPIADQALRTDEPSASVRGGD
jgi:N-acetylmuramoyl-L-alanine amidase